MKKLLWAVNKNASVYHGLCCSSIYICIRFLVKLLDIDDSLCLRIWTCHPLARFTIDANIRLTVSKVCHKEGFKVFRESWIKLTHWILWCARDDESGHWIEYVLISWIAQIDHLPTKNERQEYPLTRLLDKSPHRQISTLSGRSWRSEQLQLLTNCIYKKSLLISELHPKS